ncbi:MAG: amidohydrolase family protein [bacterium]|nr:amidohydrolase family protein [bacterium]
MPHSSSSRRIAMPDLIIRNLRLPGGTIADLVIAGGRIAEVGAGLVARHPDTEVVDGRGHLALPGLVDGHMHIDKTLLGLPWMPHPAGPERRSRIETERRLRPGLGLPVRERASNLVRRCIAHGTTAIRTHVDVDPDIRLEHLHEIFAVREQFADRVDIQIVAFPQSGVITQPGTADLLEVALCEGADLLGGIDPIAVDNDLDGQLDTLFTIAERRDKGLDVHLHDAGPGGLMELTGLVERTHAQGMEGRVTVSHGFCLGAAEEADFERVAGMMAKSEVSLVTNGAGSVPLPPVKRLREQGVTVFAGNDDVRDPWSPYGDGAMLERAMLIAWRSGYRTDEDLAIAFDTATRAGARALGLEGHGLAVGARADLFTVPTEFLAEAIVSRPKRSLVVKAGAIVAHDGVLVEIM